MPLIDRYKKFKLERGLWYDSCTRIFTIGGSQRIAEISNHPRVYEDKVLHIYKVDVPFTVTEHDLVEVPKDYGGGQGYFDNKEDKYYRIGEIAVHHKGDLLPGCFPKWLEYLSPQPVMNHSVLSFALTGVPKPIELLSTSILNDMTIELSDLTGGALEDFKNQIGSNEIRLAMWLPGNRFTLYFHYLRRFR